MELSEAISILRAMSQSAAVPLSNAEKVAVRTVLAAHEAAAKERDELREALGWFLDDERFHVAVGGNQNAVQKMIHDARLLYIGPLPEVTTP